MNKILYILLTFIFTLPAYCQIPTNCIEIESILVDACGSPEGENEMVRFQVGPNPIDLNTMTVSWPNPSNPWLGLCQNATTASVVSTWNSTITECGYLIEPTTNFIPVGERVIFVTSTNVIPGANSFAGLSDTIYVIFQCPGNTSGHFANYGVGLRTLTINIGACSDVVTYDRSLLEDQMGNNVAADGATVLFDWSGNPDYVNTGCNAPVVPLVVDAGANQSGYCPGDTINLTGYTQGSFSNFNWTGGTGTFINPNSDTNAFYIVGIGDASPINIFFNATNCNGTITDTMQIILSSPTPVNISPSGPVSICTGDTVVLTASGPGPFLWNTSSTSSSISVNTPGTYIVTQTSACGNSIDSVVVNSSGTPPVASIVALGPTELCPGETVTLQASGGGTYLWDDFSTGSTLVATLPVQYMVVVSNACGSDTAFITLTAGDAAVANISPSSPMYICSGDSVEVTVSGNGTFTWSNGASGNAQYFNTPGSYYVIATTACGNDTAFFDILPDNIAAGFTASTMFGPSPLLVNFNNTSVGGDQYNWTFGDGGASNAFNPEYTYTLPGTYLCTLITTSINGCTDTATTIIVVDSCIYAIKVPNVMTPNGDGVNDVYHVSGNCINEFNGVIFDRWGLRVFEWNDWMQGWDGSSLTGSKVTNGVYHYIIQIMDYNGDPHEYVGFIQVLQ